MGEGKDSSYSVEEAIKMADFEKDIPYNKWLNTKVGEGGMTLSGVTDKEYRLLEHYKNSEVLV